MTRAVVKKLKEVDAAMQKWAEQPSIWQQWRQKEEQLLAERKTWSFWKRLKWALGFRKNLYK